MGKKGTNLNLVYLPGLPCYLAQSAMVAIVGYFGETQGLQNVLIIAALPFSIVIMLMGVSFFKAVQQEDRDNAK